MRGVSEAARQREALRQQQLLGALFEPPATPTPTPDALPGWTRGLAAYRANAAGHACEVLRAQYPSVLAMLGDRSFDALATAHWLACPPTLGDLARFGGQFPAWLGGRDDLAAWPWLEDCARLDQALWQAQFAAPPALRDADLQRLATADPDALVLRLAPSTCLLESDWAVVTLRELHAAPAPDVDAVTRALHAAGESAWIWREGYDTRCVALDAAAAHWHRALREAPTLGAALERADAAFDVGAWLAAAVRAGWIDGVDAVRNQENRE